MSIQAAAASRETAAAEREASRAFAAHVATKAAEIRRDSRIAEAKEATASRPRPQDREERPATRPRLFDVTV